VSKFLSYGGISELIFLSRIAPGDCVEWCFWRFLSRRVSSEFHIAIVSPKSQLLAGTDFEGEHQKNIRKFAFEEIEILNIFFCKIEDFYLVGDACPILIRFILEKRNSFSVFASILRQCSSCLNPYCLQFNTK